MDMMDDYGIGDMTAITMTYADIHVTEDLFHISERRTDMAHLYEAICTMEEDQVKKELEARRHLLDKDICIAVTGHCSCPYVFEQYPVTGEGRADDVLTQSLEMIRSGHCRCPSVDHSRTASRRLIHLATALGKTWLIDYLLDHGCDLNIYTRVCRYGPLLIAINWQYPNVVRRLIERGADVNPIATSGDKLPLISAMDICSKPGGNDDNIFEIVLRSCQFDSTIGMKAGETALLTAFSSGRIWAVKRLLENKANPNVADQDGDTLLYQAAMNNKPDVVTALLKSGVDIDKTNEIEGATALHVAIEEERESIVRELLCSGADVNKRRSDGMAPLSIATEGKNYRIVEMLLIHGADSNAPDTDGEIELHIAASCGYQELIDLLLKYGANPNAVSGVDGCAPLTQVSGSFNEDRLSSLTKLISAGADVNVVDMNNMTPLHRTAFVGFHDGAQLLLERGADPNCADKCLATALWYAMFSRKLDIVKALLRRNVVMETISRGYDMFEEYGDDYIYESKKSVLWVAVDRGGECFVDLLVDAGYNLWKEAWLLQNNTADLPETRLPLVQKLQTIVHPAPSLMFVCRRYFRAQFRHNAGLEDMVQTTPFIPNELKSFLFLTDVRQLR